LHVGLVLKATRRCNLRCQYCHDWRSGRESDMSFETAARVIASVLRHPSVTTVLCTWHGGEPTLLPLDFYRRVLNAQARLRREGQKLRNGIQTNGTLLNNERCQFLADNDFYVGVSVDGPQSLQDMQRPFISGRGSSETVYRGLRLLQDWGIDHGVLMVVDRATIELGPRALFEFLLRLGAKRVGLNAARPTNDPNFFDLPPAQRRTSPAHYISQGEATAFFLGLYEEYEKHRNAGIEIRNFEALRRRINGGSAQICTLAGACIGRHFLVEANGDFAHCDLFVGDPAYTLGNVYTSDFAAILQSEATVRLQRIEAARERKMAGCPHYAVCNGGCPHDRYTAMRYDPAYREDCCGQGELIAALAERMRDRAPIADAAAFADTAPGVEAALVP
jgi:uncharacterized protein